jgi:iron complex outermembrane receptor protein
MRLRSTLFLSTALLAATPAFGQAQNAGEGQTDAAAQTSPRAQADATGTPAVQTQSPQDQALDDIVVTARKREETLLDVPIAVTAVSGDLIERRGLTSVKDIAQFTPGLNINSDGAGRAFVSIRGVGTTLVDSVQPGVGIFLDGIYQPNTSYLNNPLVDVARVEVLRGPQGTLYGKNTLGGAINVVTRAPSNDFEGKVLASYAGSDNAWFAGGSISGPIVRDLLQFRVAYAHRQQDGFLENVTLGLPANPLNTDSLNATLRFEPAPDVVLTVNGYYDWVEGATTPYAYVAGPTDYSRDIAFNYSNYQSLRYKRANAKLDVPVEALATTLTLIGAYDERSARTPAQDLDFSPVDIARNSGVDVLRTRTVEARADTKLSDTFSSILGFFYNRETRDTNTLTTILPGVLDIQNRQIARTSNDTYAVFGNVFWRPTTAVELSAGLRYDDQSRDLRGQIVLNGTAAAPTTATLGENHWSPRVAATYHWSGDLMTYASISRGFRGGGFNPPVAPANLQTYKGDNVWTYELGSKYQSPDRVFSLSGAVFYNDYKDYIGLNSIAPAVTGGFTTVDLNSGDVESYGIELEGSVRPARDWTISGGISLQHARLTNTDIYTELTGRTLSSNRLTFQPDYNYNINTDYVVHLGADTLILAAGLVGKGSRLAATLKETTPTILKAYNLANASITYKTGGLELSAFVDNAFNANYFESYIEKTTLILAGLTPTDVGIVGDRRRFGIRGRFTF